MQYDVHDDTHRYLDGETAIYFTVDSLVAPTVQTADTQAGVLTCAAIDENYRFYFDYKKDDFVILRRQGKVEIHRISIQERKEKLTEAWVNKQFVFPFPGELNKHCKATGDILKERWWDVE